jgi:probable phosphoglycerate mutase
MPSGDLFAADASTKSRNTGAVVLAHCDGGARGNPGPAGYGAVIATEDGTVLAELSEFLGFKTNNFAEYSGLLGVLQWALDNNHLKVKVVSDSELMVKQIQGKYKVNSPDLKPLWEEAKRRIAKLDFFNISHALRHKNKTADRLANEAMDRGMGRPAASAPLKATPYPTKSSEPAAPKRMDPLPPEPRPSAPAGAEMLRGFVKDGAIVLLGGKSLPDGVFVKVIRE